MKEDLKKLYSKLILEKQHDTSGFEKREDASHILEAYNPLCGDQFKLYLDLQDGQLVKASYHGYGCALSKVSTALLIERLQGKSIDESKELILDYFNDLKVRQHILMRSSRRLQGPKVSQVESSALY